jgi:serine phosphatase RsbU (regulator of sigma subunit)
MSISLNQSSKLRILVVDDEAAFIYQTTDCLERAGYEVVVARNGREALSIADRGDVDLILLDVIMPVLNGVEVTKILKRNPLTKNIPIIVISTMTEYKERVEFFRIGANDYMPKPIDNGELLARSELQLSLVRLRREVEAVNASLQQKNRMLEQHMARVEHDLAVARGVQRAIFPPPDLELRNLSVHFRHFSSENLHSDYFDYQWDEAAGVFNMLVADVSGHGIASALLAAQLKVLFVTLTQQRPSPKEFMDEVNQFSVKFLTEGYYFTAIYSQYRPATKSLVLVNAGHVPLLYLEHGAGKIKQVESNNSPLGFFAGERYTEVELGVQEGDRVVVCTDGLTEHTNGANEMFGIEGVISALRQYGASPPDELAGLIVKQAREFGSAPVFRDDMTLGVVRFGQAQRAGGQ